MAVTVYHAIDWTVRRPRADRNQPGARSNLSRRLNMSKRTCSIEGCDRGGKITRGWCAMHYGRWLKRGDPNAVSFVRLTGSVSERLWAKVTKTATCWLWNGTLSLGYGKIDGRPVHVVAYELEVGSVPPGAELDHICHDPAVCKLGVQCPHRSCVNPSHLKPVSRRENVLRSNSPSAMQAAADRCPRGHPYVPGNLALVKGHRRCLTCKRAAGRANYYRTKAKNLEGRS